MALKKKSFNGLVKLTAKRGVLDTRTGRVYSEVVCKENDKHYFKEA